MEANKTAKVMAIIALFGILISIIGTGILVIYETYVNPTALVSQEQTNSGLTLTGTDLTGSTLTGSINVGTGLNIK